MEEYPDSALEILKSISPDDLTDDGSIALYGLLYTQALDKNHLCPTNDSIISLAVDYYRSEGDVLRRVLSNYYQGRARYNAGNNSMAIVSFFKAKELAESNGLDFWAGMACRGISDIYNDTYNSAEELAFAEREYELIKKSGRQPYLNYALNDLGKALYNNGDHERSISISKQLTDSSDRYDDPYLYTCARNLLAYNLMYKEKYDEAYPVLSEICDREYAETMDSINLCIAMLKTNRIAEANTLRKNISEIHGTFGHMFEYQTAKQRGDWLSALDEIESIDSISDSQFREAMSHDLTSSLIGYLEQQNKLDKVEMKISRIRMWSAIIILFLILLLISCIGLLVYFRQKRIIADKMLLATQLQNELDSASRENSNSDLIIRSLLQSKYALLEEFSDFMIQKGESNCSHRKITEALTKIFDDLSVGNERITALENEVDYAHHNLISDFRKELPGLKDADYKLFLFSVLGLSAATISILLKEGKIEAVYNRKRRLKNKIKQLTTPNQERFLLYLR